ncbi:MAG: hypothetical protein FJ206_07455 [Gemmatimonadetes bacterium]|nr:hypothetical protein [Gemmatimonadota bacterium]
MATELGGTQVASLLETLPGIASVLRNPVADAFVGLIRAGARLGEFKIGDAEEILRYAVRRTLMTQDETDRVLAEVKAAVDRRAERALERATERAKKPATPTKAKAKAKPAKRPAPKPGKKKKR